MNADKPKDKKDPKSKAEEQTNSVEPKIVLPKPLDQSPYQYVHKNEPKWVERITKDIESCHLSPEEVREFHEISCIPLPTPSTHELVDLIDPTHIPLPELSEEEEEYLLAHDEVSSDESNAASALSTPQVLPATPDTDLSRPSSPHVLEVVKPECHVDEVMAEAVESLPDVATIDDQVMAGCIENLQSIAVPDEVMGEGEENLQSTSVPDEVMVESDDDLQSTSVPEEVMTERIEDIADGRSYDRDMSTFSVVCSWRSSTISVDLQEQTTENVDMVITRNDDSKQTSTSQVPSKDEVTEITAASASIEVQEPIESQEMEGVSLIPQLFSSSTPSPASSTTEISSSPIPVQNAVTLYTPPPATGRGTWIWTRFKQLGPNLYTDLRDENGFVRQEVLQIEPQLDTIIIKHIRVASSSVRLINLLKVDVSQGYLSLKQARSLYRCVVDVRAAAARLAKRDNWLSGLFTELLMPLQATAPIPIPSNEESTPQPEDPVVLFDLDTQLVVGLLKSARDFTVKQIWASRASDMIDLPWNDKEAMEKAVDSLLKSPAWGGGSVEKLKTKIEGLYIPQTNSEPASAIPKMIWNLCKAVQHPKLKPEPIPRGYTCSYQKQRTQALRSLFDLIVQGNFDNLKLCFTTTCMSWEQMRDLAIREENHFLATRFGTNQDRSERSYKRYIEERKKHWQDIEHVRMHIDALSLQIPLSNEHDSAALKHDLATRKRTEMSDEDELRSKRTRMEKEKNKLVGDEPVTGQRRLRDETEGM